MMAQLVSLPVVFKMVSSLTDVLEQLNKPL
jgi:hypothetical protein